jgi:hypothetical protein
LPLARSAVTIARYFLLFLAPKWALIRELWHEEGLS